MLDFSDPLFFWSLLTLLAIISFMFAGGIWMSFMSWRTARAGQAMTAEIGIQDEIATISAEPAAPCPPEQSEAATDELAVAEQKPLYLQRRLKPRRNFH